MQVILFGGRVETFVPQGVRMDVALPRLCLTTSPAQLLRMPQPHVPSPLPSRRSSPSSSPRCTRWHGPSSGCGTHWSEWRPWWACGKPRLLRCHRFAPSQPPLTSLHLFLPYDLILRHLMLLCWPSSRVSPRLCSPPPSPVSAATSGRARRKVRGREDVTERGSEALRRRARGQGEGEDGVSIRGERDGEGENARD